LSTEIPPLSFLTWHLACLILEGNGDFGFEEAELLFLRGLHKIIVSKLISPVKFCTIDFFTGFAP
jgi:hypothetical protein